LTGAILTLNAGSSSLKFALFPAPAMEPHPVLTGLIEGIGSSPYLIAVTADGQVVAEQAWPDRRELGHETFLTNMFELVDQQLNGDRLLAVGHRVVHGGADFSEPVLVDDHVMQKLEALSPLAPLHQPHNLAAIRAAQATRPGLPQVACFDTAFHHGHADIVTRFALPRAWHDMGVRRYGFHGLSYEYISRELRRLDPEMAAGRVIVAHLGNGASLCAIHDGRSVDTTMGFTALDGLMMGTRCGALDPGVILYMQQQAGLTAGAVQALLYECSGLLGVSGLSGDMRDLIASDEPAAREAIDLFTFRTAREMGALTTSLGGLDSIVFTAGIGENVAEVRAGVARHLAWTGLVLDPEANARNADVISTTASRVQVRVIPTNEEAMIARHTAGLLIQTSRAG